MGSWHIIRLVHEPRHHGSVWELPSERRHSFASNNLGVSCEWPLLEGLPWHVTAVVIVRWIGLRRICVIFSLLSHSPVFQSSAYYASYYTIALWSGLGRRQMVLRYSITAFCCIVTLSSLMGRTLLPDVPVSWSSFKSRIHWWRNVWLYRQWYVGNVLVHAQILCPTYKTVVWGVGCANLHLQVDVLLFFVVQGDCMYTQER